MCNETIQPPETNGTIIYWGPSLLGAEFVRGRVCQGRDCQGPRCPGIPSSDPPTSRLLNHSSIGMPTNRPSHTQSHLSVHPKLVDLGEGTRLSSFMGGWKAADTADGC